MRFRISFQIAVFSVMILCGRIAPSQTNQPTSADQRQQVHSEQVHGGTPGQIPERLAHTSGDVHLRNTQAPPMIIQLDPKSTLENLSCENDLVVVGKVGNGTSHPTTDQGYIYTDWDIAVVETIKNNARSRVQVGQVIVVMRPGGTLVINGRHVDTLSDSPQFETGNEVLLYVHFLPDTGTYSLSVPNGFIFAGSQRIDLDKSRFGQFGTMGKSAVLELAREGASQRCAAGQSGAPDEAFRLKEPVSSGPRFPRFL